jgi:hypothetical protein
MNDALSRPTMMILAWLFGSMASWIFGAGPAHACSCEQISPAEGFDRAQYVFSGRIAETSGHTWVVDVNRVWKGAGFPTMSISPIARLRARRSKSWNRGNEPWNVPKAEPGNIASGRQLERRIDFKERREGLETDRSSNGPAPS